MTIKELEQYLYSKGYAFVGCSSKEIAKIEKYFNVALPRVYLEYLSTMGKSAGEFMLGSSAFYDEILDLREDSISLLEDNDFKPLPENAFVFWMHQGYQFAFFLTDSGEDPAVFYYFEKRTKDDFEKMENSLTDFFKNQIPMSGL